ncbi:nuclear speckle splicing regulatory protein 1 [Episyrphus balteatus]|uniref:nuclear speckle splicing regulatory protein 1 n=1 Tax=Episyrphus balteatus TaxID=286459 RepID=UPI0024851202|nr:nuclear speckle splicing regulatory protein 1 [Episyrphus balteatus]
MSKQYGLIIPGKQKPIEPPKSDFSKPSIFGESSESDDDHGLPQLKMKSAPYAPGATEKRIAKKLQEKALKEDPTVFQYDELYDEIENKRDEAKKAKSNEVKKPKYIGRLLQCAEKRKLENERRIERMVQKEREQEGEEFKDKESFVTSTYRKKLEEMQKAEDQEKREDYLEAIGDVTKQKDLDGFYRHLYEQKLGPKESTNKVIALPEVVPPQDDDNIAYKPIKSGKPRAYRKRKSSAEEEEESVTTEPTKRAHIQSNLDADSDFSIDSSSDEDETSKKKTNNLSVEIKKEPEEEEKQPTAEVTFAVPKEIKLETVKKEEEIVEEKEIVSKPTIDRTLIWKKRTVGDAFDAALQRYFQRKAARNG